MSPHGCNFIMPSALTLIRFSMCMPWMNCGPTSKKAKQEGSKAGMSNPTTDAMAFISFSVPNWIYFCTSSDMGTFGNLRTYTLKCSFSAFKVSRPKALVHGTASHKAFLPEMIPNWTSLAAKLCVFFVF